MTGDHLLREITPTPVLNVPREGSLFQYTSLREYLASLRKIEGLDLTLLLPGHGEEIDNPKELIQNIFDHHSERMDRILSVLSERKQTPYEIAMDLFPGVPPFEVFLGISEVLGHLEILKEKGKVRVDEKGGIDYYCVEQGR